MLFRIKKIPVKILIIISIIFLQLSITNSYAQKFEVTPFVGYELAGTLRTEQGDISLENGFNYGLIFDVTVERDLQAEFWYSRLESGLSFKEQGSDQYNYLFDMSIEYFHAGALYVADRGKVRPIGIFTLGATRFHPKDSDIEDDWRFSIAVGGGAKFFFTENIGLRVQGRLLIPLFLTDTSIFCTNGTCFINVQAGNMIIQADMNVGLIIAF